MIVFRLSRMKQLACQQWLWIKHFYMFQEPKIARLAKSKKVSFGILTDDKFGRLDKKQQDGEVFEC